MIRLIHQYLARRHARRLALHGAAIRKSQWIAKRNSVAAQLCIEAGRPVPKVLQK